MFSLGVVDDLSLLELPTEKLNEHTPVAGLARLARVEQASACKRLEPVGKIALSNMLFEKMERLAATVLWTVNGLSQMEGSQKPVPGSPRPM